MFPEKELDLLNTKQLAICHGRGDGHNLNGHVHAYGCDCGRGCGRADSRDASFLLT